ncbi:MAG: GyrI-like domain-containing protein [Hyphomicrobiales bacterium]|nr:GyrI-like domain-containing protein [Hyphomicrobiales bacterium]MBV9519881.1 GyrI-like domain-containing protein [Hyphomicrobiales bacterium]
MRHFKTPLPGRPSAALKLLTLTLGLLFSFDAGLARAQTAVKPGAVESSPIPAPSAGAPATPTAPVTPSPSVQPAPPMPQAQTQAPAPSPPASTDAAHATLGPAPSDPSTPDELTIAPKAEAFVVGEASWDDALSTIRDAQKKVRAALDGAGIKVSGRPLTRFVKTGDDKFSYEIGYPIAEPTGQVSLPPDIKLGTTPSGDAIRFVHHGSYDDIDGTYEAITVDLDAKGIEVNDAFLEEYVNDVNDSTDSDLEVYIYVFKK